MTTMSLMPDFTQQFFDNNGDPLAGGKLYFYEPGTTTSKAAYADSGGLVALTNPVTLDSSGRTTVFLNGYYKIILKDADNVTIDTLDNVSSQYYQTSTYTQWIAQSETFTYDSATRLSVSGDKTADFEIGRRINAVVTAGTIAGTIIASSASGAPAVTTIDVAWDNGSLDSGLSSVSLGLPTESENSLPVLTAFRRESAYSLTLSDYNKIIPLTGSANTLTLLPANEVPSGFKFDFINLRPFPITVVGEINYCANVTFLRHEGASVFSDGNSWFSFNMHNSDPIGTVKAWHKSANGTPQTLPWGWVECNGSALSDAESPLNGITLPAINNTGRFIRGSNTSGTTQANQYANHTHGLTLTHGANAYTRVRQNITDLLRVGYIDANSSTIGVQLVPILESGTLLCRADDSTWDYTGSGIGASGNGTETRPDNISMVYIIKIK